MALSVFISSIWTSPEFEIWRRFFSILLIVILTFVLASIINHLMTRMFRRIIRKRKEHPELHTDTTKFVVMKRVIQVVVYLIGFAAIVYVIPEFRALSYSILVGAGVAAVIIGLAAQKTFANIMSGIVLATSEPIRVGDRVTISNHYGIIEDITLRHTVIKTWDNNRVMIPNAVLNDAEIINHTIVDSKIIQTVEVGISYDADMDKAKRIMFEEVTKHPNFTRHYEETGSYVKGTEDVTIRVMEYADFAIKLKAYFWASDKLTGFTMEKELLESIKKRFDKEGIEIPFPYRTIVYKKDLKKASGKGRSASAGKVSSKKRRR